MPVKSWPAESTQARLGQVSGVTLDIHGNPVIFHRGNIVWNARSFYSDNTYRGDRQKPIPVNTVLTLNSSGFVVNEWGSDFFFMPHMITVDRKNNFWMTDVARHQVFMFGPYGGESHEPLIELGEKFIPGSDEKHFCKPTSVAVAEDFFYIADGYCNSRIIKYKISYGEYVM